MTAEQQQIDPKDPELQANVFGRAADYHDTVVRTMARMASGQLSIKEATARVMSLSMDFDRVVSEENTLVTPKRRVEMISEDFGRIVRGEPTRRLPTGLPCLDNVLLGGLPPGAVTVVGGAPGAGKSVVLQQFGEYAALQGKNVLFVAVEMDAIQLSYRTLARMTSIDASRIQRNKLSDRERAKVQECIAKLEALNIVYKDGGDFSTGGIYRAVLEAQEELNGPIDLIVADYLQILQDGNAGGNENMRLTGICHALLHMARQFGCPVLTGSQLNRESVKAGTRPRLHHLRDSGSIGQDASVVLLLHPDYDPNSGEEKQDLEKVTIIVEKNRGAISGVDVICTFEQPFQRFREWDAKQQGRAGEGVVYTAAHDREMLGEAS